MTNAGQNAHVSYRVVSFDRDGTKVLLARNGDQLALPSIVVPTRNRLAETLTTAVKADWGAGVLCLFDRHALAGIDGNGTPYEVPEYWRPGYRPEAPTCWLSVAAMSQESIDRGELSAVRKAVAQCNAAMEDSSLGPFACLGWFCELREWIPGVIESATLSPCSKAADYSCQLPTG